MDKNLKHYILQKNQFINADICDQAVKEMKDIKFKKHKFYSDITKKLVSASGEQECDMSFDNISTKKIIMDKLWYAISDYIKFINFDWFIEWQGYTNLKFNKYTKNKKMALHCDHIKDMFDGEIKGIPILSIVGLLNDDYEGGKFIMFDKEDIKLNKGDILIFPSNFLYPHKVEPVIKGTRYSYVSWVW
jgi:hypothetical protein